MIVIVLSCCFEFHRWLFVDGPPSVVGSPFCVVLEVGMGCDFISWWDCMFASGMSMPVGAFLLTRARTHLQSRIAADRAIRRVIGFKAGVNSLTAQNLVAKLKPSDCGGARFFRGAQVMKDMVTERKKILAAVGEKGLADNSDYMETQTLLENLTQEVVALDGQKFVHVLAKAIEVVAKSETSPGGGCVFVAKQVQECVRNLTQLAKSLGEMCWTGLTLTEELDDAAEKLRLQRIELVIMGLYHGRFPPPPC